MIATINLVNIYHLIQTHTYQKNNKEKEKTDFYSCDENSKDLFSYLLSNIWYSTVNSSHIVLYISRTHRYYNWKFVLLD